MLDILHLVYYTECNKGGRYDYSFRNYYVYNRLLFVNL